MQKKELGRQLIAEAAMYENNSWTLERGSSVTTDGEQQRFERLKLRTTASKESINLQIGSINQMDIFTLREFIQTVEKDNNNAAAAFTKLRRAEALPALFVGSLLIAFAFTVGYRRHGTSGSQVLYGIVLGVCALCCHEIA